MSLFVPRIDPDQGRLHAALAYADAGWYVGPTVAGNGKHAGSVLKTGWPAKTSRDPEVIVSWFAGTDHGVFLHAGRSGAVVVDVDQPDNLHDDIRRAVTELGRVPFQQTRPDTDPGRGHLIFRQPAGRMLGNSVGTLGGKGWGEIRGKNGIVVVAPTPHPSGEYRWLVTGLVPELPGYVADHIPDAMDAAEVATDEQVRQFLDAHTSSGRPQLLDVHAQSFLKKTSAGESRHMSMCGHLSGALKEAAAGLLDARTAADTLENLFLPAVTKPGIGKQGAARSKAEACSEWAGILAWAVAQAHAADPVETRARSSTKIPPPPTVIVADDAEFWQARPILSHIKDFARARRASPWATLGAVLARVVAAVGPHVQLPPLVGVPMSLNLFVGQVGASGAGKDAATGTAAECVNVGTLEVRTPGSGEGIAHAYVQRTKSGLTQHTTAVLFVAAEVDGLAALVARQGSTLGAELRIAYTGAQLGYAYADPQKRLIVGAHAYRLCLIVGVQPERAAPLLDEATAGTPQRFLWMPATDPDAPDVRPDEPPPATWDDPTWTPTGALTGPAGPRLIQVCDTARRGIDEARLHRLRGNGHALDGHALLTRLKVAAALGLLDSRVEVTEEDWQLAGTVMAVSDATRGQVGKALAERRAATNRARGEDEADRSVVVNERTAEHATAKVSRKAVELLRKHADWMTHAELRRAIAYHDRQWFEDAIGRGVKAGQIEVEQVTGTGEPGRRYRCPR